jgi:pSer/pThr/pTyr-binding forkhead associated (FHA) protein
MSKLILSLDGLVLREVKLDNEVVTIGRKPHNEIQIDNLAVSGEHAKLVTIGNDTVLEDLQSTNGTLVNGATVQKHLLKDGDIIEIGKYKLKFINERVAAAPTDDFEKTMIIRPGAVRPAQVVTATGPATIAPNPRLSDTQHGNATIPPAAAPATPAPAPVEAVAAIQVLTGANAGKELELTKNLTTLGKPGVQVAVITRRPQGFFITHVEGATFPLVNGTKLDAQPHQLNDHDVIELSGIKMEFYFKR